MKDANELQALLGQYYGTDQYYLNPLNPHVKYTDGAKAFFVNAGGGAYWLLDILITQPEILKAMAHDPFLTVKLTVAEDCTAELVVDNGNEGVAEGEGEYRVYYRRSLEFTDCPAGDWKLYICGGVVMLPSEY